MKKSILQLASALVIFTFAYLTNLSSFSADAILPPNSTMQSVTIPQNIQGAGPFNLSPSSPNTLNNYPVSYNISRLQADFVRNGQITNKTTKITVSFDSPNVSLSSNDYYYLRNLYNILVSDSNPNSSATEYGVDNPTGNGPIADRSTSFNFPQNRVTILLSNSKKLVSGSQYWIANKTELYQYSWFRPTASSFATTRQIPLQVSQLKLNPTINPINSNDSTISGTGTQIGDIISVQIGSDTKQTTVGNNGTWSINWQAFPENTKVIVTETNDPNNNYGDISGSTTTTTPTKPVLKFANVPTNLPFNTVSLGTSQGGYVTATRQDPNWGMDIYDNRNNGKGGNWSVSANLVSDKMTGNNGHTLTTPIIFKDTNSTSSVLSTKVPVTIFSNHSISSNSNYIRHVQFNDPNTGLLIRALTSEIYTNENYSGIINFTLNNVP